jgi:hypothetical protein
MRIIEVFKADELARVNCLGGPWSSFIPATRGDLSCRPAALAGKGSTEGRH